MHEPSLERDAGSAQGFFETWTDQLPHKIKYSPTWNLLLCYSKLVKASLQVGLLCASTLEGVVRQHQNVHLLLVFALKVLRLIMWTLNLRVTKTFGHRRDVERVFELMGSCTF